MTMNQPGNNPAPQKKSGKGCGTFIILLLVAMAVYAGIKGNEEKPDSSDSSQARSAVSSQATGFTASGSDTGSSRILTTYSTTPTSSLWYTYDSSLHWFYAQLTTAEQRAYSARYDALALGDGSLWDISGMGLTSSQIERVEFALDSDCPELMYCDVIRRLAGFYGALGDSDWFRENTKEISSDLSSCLRELNRLKSDASWGYTDLSKEQVYERNIARKTEYLLDNDGPEGSLHIDSNVRSALSAIVNRTAVCEGFARSTQLAMRYYGIPCLYVVGDVNVSGNTFHAWNLVQIDGKWYHYDATWNSKGKYMNLSDSVLLSERTLSGDYARLGFTLPRCWD